MHLSACFHALCAQPRLPASRSHAVFPRPRPRRPAPLGSGSSSSNARSFAAVARNSPVGQSRTRRRPGTTCSTVCASAWFCDSTDGGDTCGQRMPPGIVSTGLQGGASILISPRAACKSALSALNVPFAPTHTSMPQLTHTVPGGACGRPSPPLRQAHRHSRRDIRAGRRARDARSLPPPAPPPAPTENSCSSLSSRPRCASAVGRAGATPPPLGPRKLVVR